MAFASTQIAALTTPDLYRVFLSVGEDMPAEYSMWCNTADMPWNPMTDREVAGLRSLVAKPEGTRFPLDEATVGNARTITAVPYASALEFTWEGFRDELYGVIKDLVAQLSRASREQLEIEAHKLLNNAFSSTAARDLGFDGDVLISTTHTGIDGVDRTNRPASAIGFSQLALQEAVQRMHSLTNESGMRQRLNLASFIISPDNLFTAREILGSPAKPFTANNEINSLVAEEFSWMVDHYLTTSTAWYGLASKASHDLFLYFRDHPMFDSFDDPWTKNAVYVVYQRDVSAFSAWRGVDGDAGV
jgi:hypothetical protein